MFLKNHCNDAGTQPPVNLKVADRSHSTIMRVYIIKDSSSSHSQLLEIMMNIWNIITIMRWGQGLHPMLRNYILLEVQGRASRGLHFFREPIVNLGTHREPWYQDLSTKILVPGSWYQDLVPRSWCQDLGRSWYQVSRWVPRFTMGSRKK